MTRTFAREESGFGVVGLRSEAADVAVVPELGARVLSLQDRRAGREWLDRPLGRALFRNKLGDPFTAGTFAGIDESIPTISPCRWHGRDLADHGEAWSAAWTLDRADFEAGRITTRLALPVSPLEITRTIHLDRATLMLDYAVRNLAATPEAFLWAFHPLFATKEGDRVELSPEVRVAYVEAAQGVAGPVQSWPGAPPLRLDRIELAPDAWVKLLVGPLREGRAGLVNDRTGDRLDLAWDASINPWLGVWLTRGGYRGFHHVALEPSNAGTDSLADAVAPEPLAAGAERRWRVTINLTAGNAGAREGSDA